MSPREMISERHGRLFLSTILFQIFFFKLDDVTCSSPCPLALDKPKKQKYYIGSSIYSRKYNMQCLLYSRPTEKMKKKKRETESEAPFILAPDRVTFVL